MGAFDKLPPRSPVTAFSITAYNAMLDMLNWWKTERGGGGRHGGGGFPPRGDVVWIKNSSGADRDRFDILGISDVLYDEAEAPDEFKNKRPLVGIVPDAAIHVGKFAILLQPVANGAMGQACVSGICVARVTVPEDGPSFSRVDIKHANAATLIPSKFGAAQILWVENGIGVQWAVVRLGLASVQTFLQSVRVRTESLRLNATGEMVHYFPVKFAPNGGPDVGDEFFAYLRVPAGVASAVYEPGTYSSGLVDVMQHEDGKYYIVSPATDSAIGTIKLWSGSIASIPKLGWRLCDGQNGTPDLRGKFVVGASDSGEYVKGATGGYAKHGPSENNHTDHAEHRHLPLVSDSYWFTPGETELVVPWSMPFHPALAHSETDNRPPYYALAYIMRVANLT